jgi:hypothetical protein
MIEVKYGLDEQIEFDVEPFARGGVVGLYLGIHTRTSDKSFSTSRGLAT